MKPVSVVFLPHLANKEKFDGQEYIIIQIDIVNSTSHIILLVNIWLYLSFRDE